MPNLAKYRYAVNQSANEDHGRSSCYMGISRRYEKKMYKENKNKNGSDEEKSLSKKYSLAVEVSTDTPRHTYPILTIVSIHASYPPIFTHSGSALLLVLGERRKEARCKLLVSEAQNTAPIPHRAGALTAPPQDARYAASRYERSRSS